MVTSETTTRLVGFIFKILSKISKLNFEIFDKTKTVIDFSMNFGVYFVVVDVLVN